VAITTTFDATSPAEVAAALTVIARHLAAEWGREADPAEAADYLSSFGASDFAGWQIQPATDAWFGATATVRMAASDQLGI
jgi:hypothetical protein